MKFHLIWGTNLLANLMQFVKMHSYSYVSKTKKKNTERRNIDQIKQEMENGEKE